MVALYNAQNSTHRLAIDESASIHVHSMEFDRGPSLFELLDQSLRDANRGVTWFNSSCVTTFFCTLNIKGIYFVNNVCISFVHLSYKVRIAATSIAPMTNAILRPAAKSAPAAAKSTAPASSVKQHALAGKKCITSPPTRTVKTVEEAAAQLTKVRYLCFRRSLSIATDFNT
ncbi:unnamed protein product [Rotaria sp. Silwood2]|nr:unnamed protein product [Rotaria sp. Silwood2]